MFHDFEGWLSALGGCRVHGRLFAPDRVQFAGREKVFAGGLSDAATLRDYNPRSFLTNLLWATRGERQCFQTNPGDTLGKGLEVLRFVAGDRNAQISVISGAWAVQLSAMTGEMGAIRREAARLQRIEMAMLDILRAPETRARVRIWTMAEFLENPGAAMQPVLSELAPQGLSRPLQPPELVDLARFGSFLQALRNQGMQPVLMGDFPTIRSLPDPAHWMK